VKVAILCPGLGHVPRGFETFAAECADALRSETDMEVMVVGGGRDAERAAWCIRRGSRAAWVWNRLADRTDPYRLEQATFALGVLPLLARERPDVLLLSDYELGRTLARVRRLLPGAPRIVFSNGGPHPGPFAHVQRVQHVTPVTRASAVRAGEPKGRHALLPYGVRMASSFSPLRSDDRRSLRARLGLPGDRPVALSVAALECKYKRLDVLVEATAALPARERPHLVLLGQPTAQTPALRTLAATRLGVGGSTIRTVTPGEVADYYRVADAFVLPSLTEGFGRVLVEAAAAGLPCLAHSGPVQRFVLGELDPGLDLRESEPLARALRATLAAPRDPAAARRRHALMRERFSWERLAPRYAALLADGTAA
jgi:glycosyltransferase involved in cell wall biosynthesis